MALAAAKFWKMKDDISFIKSVDSGILDYEDVSKPSPTTTIVYYSYKLPPGLKNRDFLVKSENRVQPEKGVYESIQRSTVDVQKPEVPKKFIRAFMFNYTRLERVETAPGEPEAHESIQLFCTDLRGKIPMSVIQKASSARDHSKKKRTRKASTTAGPKAIHIHGSGDRVGSKNHQSRAVTGMTIARVNSL